ncbi:MAG: DUF4837 family protein [Bacteroidetes bacterium]|nr:DUF4837 family protein [Bacteroidota bacterium]
MRLMLFFSLFFITLSCGRYEDEGLQVTGKIGELLIVADDDIWNSPEVKAALDSALTRFIMPYIPDVSTFELIHRNHSTFDGGIKRHRNVLIINLLPETQNAMAELNFIKEGWARDQAIMEINVRDKKQLIKLLNSKTIDQVHNYYDECEWKRIVERFGKEQNEYVQQEIKKTFGIDIQLPDGSGIVTSNQNFYRIEFPPASRPIEFPNIGKQDVGVIWEGVMIYQYDFKDSSQLRFESLLRARDTMLKYNVPHEIEGQYMGTQYVKMVYPEMTATTNINGSVKGLEMRGMFQFQGNTIPTTGGAFWAFHFVHPTRKKVICISGYVDAPVTTSWTHFLREIQAVWKSVELIR